MFYQNSSRFWVKKGIELVLLVFILYKSANIQNSFNINALNQLQGIKTSNQQACQQRFSGISRNKNIDKIMLDTKKKTN